MVNLCYLGNNKLTTMESKTCIGVKIKVAPVAQLDRAPDYGTEEFFRVTLG